MQVKKESVEKAILVAATRTFASVGYRRASLRRIARDAGTTIGNLYHYFENKEALFDACVFPLMEQIDVLLTTHHGLDPLPEGMSLSAWLTRFFSSLDSEIVEQMRVLLMEDPPPPLDRHRRKLEQMLASHLLEDHGIGGDLVGRTLLAAFLSGLRTLLGATEDPGERARAMTGLVMLYIAGMPGVGGEEER
jgi:AcrR family transcriptional regulator